MSRGVTLSYFYAFIDNHGGRAAFESLTTANVCTQFVMPMTALSKKSVVDHVHSQPGGERYVTPAQWLISHSWSYKFLDVVDAIDNFCREQELSPDTSFWFCMFANNQHTIGDPTTMFEMFLQAFRTALQDTGQLVMVLSPWHDPATLKRTWCVYEVYLSVTLNARFEVAMGKVQKAAFLDDIHDPNSISRMRAQVNCKRSTTTVLTDRDHIFALIDNTIGGTVTLDRMVFDVMQNWVLGTLAQQVKSATQAQDRFQWLFTHAQTLVVASLFGDAIHVFDTAVNVFSSDLPRSFWPGWKAIYRFAELKAHAGHPPETWDAMLDEALSMLAQLLGPDHSETLSAMRDAGNCFARAGNPTRGTALLRECLALEQAKTTAKDDMVTTMHLLSDSLCSQGHLVEAQQLYHQALAGYVRLYGPLHDRAMAVQTSLSFTYYRQGRYDRAKTTLHPLLEETNRTLGPTHQQTISRNGNYAAILRMCGQFAVADDMLCQCIQLAHESDVTLWVKIWLRHRAHTKWCQGKFAQAKELVDQAITAAVGGPKSFVVQAVLCSFHIRREMPTEFVSVEAIDRFMGLLDREGLNHETWSETLCHGCYETIQGDLSMCSTCPRLAIHFCHTCVESKATKVCDHIDGPWTVIKPPMRYLLEQKLHVVHNQRQAGWEHLYAKTAADYAAHCDTFSVDDRLPLQTMSVEDGVDSPCRDGGKNSPVDGSIKIEFLL